LIDEVEIAPSSPGPLKSAIGPVDTVLGKAPAAVRLTPKPSVCESRPMNAETLEEILACPSLPSLPSVAVRVLELTKNPDVGVEQLAGAIQNDQALAAKVLRTVNSSFYGLRQRCTTIHQSIVMLGLSAVKSLTLGFSLVASVNEVADGTFDYVSYWRRGLYSGVAAKLIAKQIGEDFEDEAFLSGLLQDIGMMAMYQALGDAYMEVVDETEDDHRKLVRCELNAFELQHPVVGALLGKRWRLPDQLVMPIKFHERPTAAPAEHSSLVRCVALGNIAHDVLTLSDPGPPLKRFYDRAYNWFGMDNSVADELFAKVARSARELSGLFRLDTGAAADAEEILALANEQLVELAKRTEESDDPRGASIFLDPSNHDGLTGALTSSGLELALHAAYGRAGAEDEPLGVVRVCVDQLNDLRDAGADVDQVLVGVAAHLRKHFDPLGGVIAREPDDRFVVVIVGTGRVGAVKVADALRSDLETASRRWGLGDGVRGVTVSVGVAVMERSVGSVFSCPEQILVAATRAAEASTGAGGNCLRAFTPRRAA
jgi:two-component system cell cycle response regulator